MRYTNIELMILEIGDKVKVKGAKLIGEVKHLFSEHDRIYSNLSRIAKVTVYYPTEDYEMEYTIDELVKVE